MEGNTWDKTSYGKGFCVPMSPSTSFSFNNSKPCDVAGSINNVPKLLWPFASASTEYPVQVANAKNNKREENPNNLQDTTELLQLILSEERSRKNIQHVNNSGVQAKSFQEQIADPHPHAISYTNQKQFLAAGKLEQQLVPLHPNDVSSTDKKQFLTSIKGTFLDQHRAALEQEKIFKYGEIEKSKAKVNMLKEGQMIPEEKFGALGFNWNSGLQPNTTYPNSNPEILTPKFRGQKRSFGTFSTHSVEPHQEETISTFSQRKTIKVDQYPSISQSKFIDLTNDEDHAKALSIPPHPISNFAPPHEKGTTQNTSKLLSSSDLLEMNNAMKIQALENHIHFLEKKVQSDSILHAEEMKAMKEKVASLESCVGRVEALEENLINANKHISALHILASKLPSVGKLAEISKMKVEECGEMVSYLEKQVVKDSMTIESLKSSWEKLKNHYNTKEIGEQFRT